MLKPTEKQFTEAIDGIGDFTFRFTTLLDEIKIDNYASQLLRGNESPTVSAANIAAMMAALKVAAVKAPEGFNLEEIYNYDELKAVYDRYSEKVSSFRFNREDKDEGT